MGPDVIVPIGFFVMCAVLGVGIPLARAFARRMDRQSVGSPVDAELAQRMQRIEQAIDSIAVEVERISEGQRFTTKLLSDRAPSAPPPGAGGSR